MKAFRFRLQRLLDVRRLEEEQAHQRLRAAVHRLGEIESMRDALVCDRDTVFRDLAEALARGVAHPELPRNAAVHAARVDRALRECDRLREDARKAVADAEDEARRRRAAKRAIEQLGARARETWIGAVKRDENAFLDEVASARFVASRAR